MRQYFRGMGVSLFDKEEGRGVRHRERFKLLSVFNHINSLFMNADSLTVTTLSMFVTLTSISHRPQLILLIFLSPLEIDTINTIHHHDNIVVTISFVLLSSHYFVDYHRRYESNRHLYE